MRESLWSLQGSVPGAGDPLPAGMASACGG